MWVDACQRSPVLRGCDHLFFALVVRRSLRFVCVGLLRLEVSLTAEQRDQLHVMLERPTADTSEETKRRKTEVPETKQSCG